MIVTGIEFTRFMTYEHEFLKLPRRGLVLIMGSNGQGKTAFVEAIAAMWDESIRGASPWREGELGAVKVKLEGVEGVEWVERCGGKKKALTWTDSEKYPTVTKATEALTKLLPPYDVWRACSVFRGRDMASFSSATDSSRKRLLETVLQLDRFDAALEACRADLRKIEAGAQQAQRRLEGSRALLEREERSIADALAAIAEVPPAAEVDVGVIAALRAKKEKVRDQEAIAVREKDALLKVASEARAELQQAEREAERFKGGRCPTCAQSMPKDRLEGFRKSVTEASARASETGQRAQAAHAAAMVISEAARDELRALEERLAVLAEATKTAGAQSALRKRLDDQVKSSRAAVERLAKEIEAAEGTLRESEGELGTLRAVDQVLGYRGVRSAILTRALGGLEEVANAMLAKLSPTIRLEIRGYRELKDGKSTSEEISILVHGAGGGHGYRAASDGQARRIDVALLLALSAISEGVLGGEGDLWFDEVFDGLDSDGAPALADLLAEMAEGRKVVVISHNPELLRALRSRAALSIHVEDHKIQVRTT